MHARLWTGLLLQAIAGFPVLFAYGGEASRLSDDLTVRMQHGALVELIAPDGTQYVRPPVESRGMSLHRVEDTVWLGAGEPPVSVTTTSPLAVTNATFPDRPSAQAEFTAVVTGRPDELVVHQRVSDATAGVWGVGWWIADIPLEYAIVVPAGSGLRLTPETPGPLFQYDYPITWEVQMVVVEGPQGGFFVWADDTETRFKRLVIERRPSGWRLGLITINHAPFDRLTACESVTWRVGTYQGDWRVPARRYRDWFEEHASPVRVVDQQPSWVRDIRGCVIMGLDQELLDTLPQRFDPPQTLLYLYDWRAAGYDRDYPDYERMRPQLLPFIRRARELGFRVMLHVNYFGIDPLHPLYAQFEPYHVRSPWGTHAKQWWVWPPEDPDIRFAYINPASQAWRDLFVRLMTELCEATGIDALHLDQTLCIYNDQNGPIDGMTMIEGNLAIHRQLRESLPHIALSGEGLNEITCRSEAFAQRHVAGIDHSKGTYDRRWLAAAHPISSYILGPYTRIYGYLGCASPEDEQLYAAWNEAYRHWGVIPTWKPSRRSLESPEGFSRQFFDELRVWQTRRVTPDMEGDWPRDIAFPLRTADGEPFLATQDRRWVCGEQLISRTITGVTQVSGDGTIPGWYAYDDQRLIGLHAERWYPYFRTPRSTSSFHVNRLPDDVTVDTVSLSENLTMVKVRDARPVVADLTQLLEQARIGSRLDDGSAREQVGPWESPDGAAFSAFGDTLSAHPPWKLGAYGQAYARFVLALPEASRLEFVAEVFMDPSSVGQPNSDGAVFFVRGTDGSAQFEQSVHQVSAEPTRMTLDLTSFQGRQIELELAIDPGPANSPSYDWARWKGPRIVRQRLTREPIGWGGTTSWQLALAADGQTSLGQQAEQRSVTVTVPGTVILLRRIPAESSLPLDLTRIPDETFFQLDCGRNVPSAPHAGVAPGNHRVAGTVRRGLLAHPPNHGKTVAVYCITLPPHPARFVSQVGLRDGSRSDGVALRVEVNGSELASQVVVPGTEERLDVDLEPWAGQTTVVALISDSLGPFNYDWAVWIEPTIVRK